MGFGSWLCAMHSPLQAVCTLTIVNVHAQPFEDTLV